MERAENFFEKVKTSFAGQTSFTGVDRIGGVRYNVHEEAIVKITNTEDKSMIKSMTGFGRCEYQQDSKKFTVELKSVNHRYLDVNIRMPKKLNFFETSIRALLKEYATRGKVDIFISYEDSAEEQKALKYHPVLAAEYVKYFRQMSEEFGIEDDLSASVLAQCPEVLVMEAQPEDEEEIWKGLKAALEGAFQQLAETRTVEGEHLKKDILGKLEHMESLVSRIEEHSPEIVAQYRAKLEEKMKDLLADTQIEESRIAAEVILFADKICTDEEIVRLKSHISHMRDTLELSEGIGRKLDFIAQEMNREANTTLSKANDLEISNYAIDLKTEIEKVREQIQNIE